MSVQSYEQLEVWQQAMDLVTLIYEVTGPFPPDERFGLTSQLRRAAVSIPSNVAEGQGRRTTGEFLALLSVARGSLMEVRTQIEIARRLGFIPEQAVLPVCDLCNRVGRLMNGLINALEQKQEQRKAGGACPPTTNHQPPTTLPVDVARRML
jgi:four helix bundle protein